MFGLLKPISSSTAASSTPARDSAADAQQLPVATPAVDLVDTGKEVVLYADLPGVDAAGLDVTVDGDRLTLRGRPSSQVPQGLTVVHREHGPRVFERSFVLSDTIDRGRIAAKISDGVATVTLPRRDAVAPRRVSVQVA